MLSDHGSSTDVGHDPHLIVPRRDRQQDYLVPNTLIRLHIVFGNPMNSGILQRTLETVWAHCTHQIASEGDGALPYDQDPFVFDFFGADVVVSSTISQHLTYGILRNVMQGLLHVLVAGNVNCDATFSIWDDNILVAEGSVGVEYVSQNESMVQHQRMARIVA
jgi:hypothetical protein